jgi:hypothetical protein
MKFEHSSISSSDMRQALIKVSLFFGLLFVLDRLVYAGATYLRDNSSHLDGIDLIYQVDSWNPSILFFGDSRTHRNFDMREIETLTGLSAYNFGFDNASAEEGLFILEQYLSHKESPHVVVFEAEPQFLGQFGKFHKEHFRDHVAVFPDTAQLLQETPPTLKQRASAVAVTWLLRSASLQNSLPDLWKRWLEPRAKSPSEVQIHPCGPPEKHMSCRYYNGSDTFVESRAEALEVKSIQFSIDAERTALFEHLVWLAEQDDFLLMLVETPYYTGDQVYPPEPTAQAKAFFCDLAQQHRRVLYARLIHGDGIDRDPAVWWDAAHFNVLGATKMSQLIAPLITAMVHDSRPEACIQE